MAESTNHFLASSSDVENVAAIIDQFIDDLQLIWATNATNGTVLLPGNRLAREIELLLIRTIGATVSPEAIYNRIGVELNRFVHQVDRIANPLFHDILICCHRLMEEWDDRGLWANIQSISDSIRDAEYVEQRRSSVVYGPPTAMDLQVLARMERTMFSDHHLRRRVEIHAQRLEEVIANFPVENDDDADIGVDSDGMDDDDVDVEMEDEELAN